MPTIRVLIADDHILVRTGLQMLLNAQPDIEVVAEAADGREALCKAREQKPDIALLDISMPETSGLKVIGQLLRECPSTRVLVLTMYEDPAYARTVLAAGGSGYVLKKATDSELLTAIRAVYRGQTFVDASLAGNLLQDHYGKKATRGPTSLRAPRDLLSPREREVLVLLAQGYTNRQVAERIFVSTKTVETYRARISQKLELHSRVELIRYALESGLLIAASGFALIGPAFLEILPTYSMSLILL